jgi:hypothetical protein
VPPAAPGAPGGPQTITGTLRVIFPDTGQLTATMTGNRAFTPHPAPGVTANAHWTVPLYF